MRYRIREEERLKRSQLKQRLWASAMEAESWQEHQLPKGED
jgi:hypothetical protein